MQRRRKTTKEERVCSICSLHFSKAEHLDRHFRSHTKEKPFPCGVCHKSFSRQDTLLRHSRSHQSPRSVPARTLSQHSQSENGANHAISASSFDNTSGSTQPDPLGSIHVPSQPRDEPVAARESNLVTALSASDGTILDDGVAILGSSIEPNLDLMSSGIMLELSQQYDWLPQWNTDINLDARAGLEVTTDQFNINWPGSPMGNMATESHPTYTGQTQSFAANPTLPEELTPISEPSFRSTNLAQRRWHTYCGDNSAVPEAPELTKDSYEVDETCQRTLADKLRQRVQDGPVPSTSFLNLAVQAYFTNFHPLFPIIHAPSFRPHSRNGVLLLSICAIGSLYLGSSKSMSYGISIYERLHKALLSSWETLVSARNRVSNIMSLQAVLLGQVFGFLMARPRDLIQVDLFHGTCIAWSRQLRVFEEEYEDIDVSCLEGKDLHVAWSSWARTEEIRRMVLALDFIDSEISCLLHHDPLLRRSVEDIPRTSSMEAFSAPNAESWKAVILKSPPPFETTDNSTPGASPFRHVTNSFELLLMLRILGSPVFEKSSSARKCQDLLIQWHRRYKSSPVFKKHEPTFMMLWHFIAMSLHVDANLLECFCGRDGPSVVEKCREKVRLWATSDDAKVCIIHAILALKQFERIPIGTEPPLHFPVCLYRCGLAWFCYTSFVDKEASCAGSEVHMPELRELNINSGVALINDAIFVDGKPAVSPLFKTIHLLQRVGHWKLGHRLASTLLALVEDEPGIL